MRKMLLGASLLLAVGSLFGADFSVGIRIGAPPPPRIVRVTPRSPGNGYVWVGGYWYASGQLWKGHDGYWARPPYGGAPGVAPRHDGERYYQGYWQNDHGQYAHDHGRDDRNRDYRD